MKLSLKALFVAAATFVALSATSCTDKQQDNAEATTENAATAAGDAVEGAVTPDSDGANTVAPENGDTAVVRNQPANGVIEETPVKK
jgi:ABC-type enterochelin transport system substrate-binding protein